MLIFCWFSLSGAVVHNLHSTSWERRRFAPHFTQWGGNGNLLSIWWVGDVKQSYFIYKTGVGQWSPHLHSYEKGLATTISSSCHELRGWLKVTLYNIIRREWPPPTFDLMGWWEESGHHPSTTNLMDRRWPAPLFRILKSRWPAITSIALHEWRFVKGYFLCNVMVKDSEGLFIDFHV